MATPQPVAIRPYRAITAPSSQNSPGALLIADAVIEEKGDDEMVITTHPVEQGAVVSDHAYRMPAILQLTYGWAMASGQNNTQDPSFLTNLYTQFLGLEAGATLLQVFTGKRIYNNMVIQAVRIDTDEQTENVLLVQVTLQELLFATTQVVNLTPAAQQQLPNKTAPLLNQGSVNLGNAPNFNSTYPGGGTNLP